MFEHGYRNTCCFAIYRNIPNASFTFWYCTSLAQLSIYYMERCYKLNHYYYHCCCYHHYYHIIIMMMLMVMVFVAVNITNFITIIIIVIIVVVIIIVIVVIIIIIIIIIIIRLHHCVIPREIETTLPCVAGLLVATIVCEGSKCGSLHCLTLWGFSTSMAKPAFLLLIWRSRGSRPVFFAVDPVLPPVEYVSETFCLQRSVI